MGDSARQCRGPPRCWVRPAARDRKSTRLNSSHGYISYAVFCLKKKKNNHPILQSVFYYVTILHSDVTRFSGTTPQYYTRRALHRDVPASSYYCLITPPRSQLRD